MALAWNAGWVNSPQGFKSPILRTQSGVRPTGRQHGRTSGNTIEEGYGPRRCGDLAWVVLSRRRRPLFLLRAPPHARVTRRHLAHAGYDAADRHRRADRARGAARRVHVAAHSSARVRHPEARGDAADLV